PMFSKKTIQGDQIILQFTHTDKGLKSANGRPLDYFEIAGSDGVFKRADVTIDGSELIVRNPFIKNPVNVRFAWDETAQPNFFNGDGLPAVPFRTNDPYRDVVL
ncbi:MAG: sialate O-acetylesterase, partial [Arachidicoccus sp.]